MAGVNKVIIVGNLGNDPEMRTFPDGGAITNISVATSEKWKDKQTGEDKESTEWHKISFNGKLAEIASQYLRKGSKVYIEGKLKTTKYQDKQTGADKYSTEVAAREMQMLDSKDSNLSQQAVAPAPAPQSQAPMSASAPAPQAPKTDQQILVEFQQIHADDQNSRNAMWSKLTQQQQATLQASLT